MTHQNHSATEPGSLADRHVSQLFLMAIAAEQVSDVAKLATHVERDVLKEGLLRACARQSVELIEVIVPMCAVEDIGLQMALSASQGHVASVGVLLPHSCQEYLRKARVMAHCCRYPEIVMVIDRHAAERQAAALTQAVTVGGGQPPKRKGRRM